MGSFGKGSLQKIFRKISAKFPQTFRRISAPFPDAMKRISCKFPQKFSAEFPQTFRNDPFANDPIPLSALLLRSEPPFTGVSGPSGPEIAKKSHKGFFGGLEKSLKKYPKKSKNTDFRTFLGIFSVFLDFFGYFLRLFSRPPKNPF